jgi:hypothetical protein
MVKLVMSVIPFLGKGAQPAVLPPGAANDAVEKASAVMTTEIIVKLD